MKLFAALLLALLLCGCGGSRRAEDRQMAQTCQASYAEGYRRGAHDMAKAIAVRAEEARTATLKAVRPRLLVGAAIASLLTLFGDAFVERMRRKLAEAFKLSCEKQAALAALTFWTSAIGAAVILWTRYGAASLPPVLILLGTAAWHLHQSYLPALLSGDKPQREIALGKLKTLLFLALAISLVFEILSKDSHLAFK